MSKILEFKSKDKAGKVKTVGSIEIKNQTASTAELYFFGDIVGSSWEAWQYEDMCPQDVSDFLKGLSGLQNVDIYINSGGGDSFAGIAIHNLLKNNRAFKTVYVVGLAASAASIIALAGDKVVVYSGAQLMIHNPWTIAMGDANDLRKVVAMLDKASESYVNIYTEHAKEGVTAEQIKTMMDAETWMTGADAAQTFNIETEDVQVAACADSQFYSRYQHAPAALVPKPEEPAKDPADAVSKQVELDVLRAKLELEIAC
jgi:ATP-dependent Clp protease protease subunit